MRALVGAGAVATAISLLLPWIDGLDDGGPYRSPGLRSAAAVHRGDRRRLRGRVGAGPALRLGRRAGRRRRAGADPLGRAPQRLLRHPRLDYGIWVCAAAQALVLLASVIETARRARTDA